MPPDHLQRQPEPRSAWRTLTHSFAPRGSRGQIITGLLCALLGFALVVQVKANQVGDQRLTASSYFIDTPNGVQVDGVLLSAPYHWLAIGDPDTMTTALSIPGGALAAVRNAGGSTDLSSRDEVQVTAVRVVERPRYATPAPAIDGG